MIYIAEHARYLRLQSTPKRHAITRPFHWDMEYLLGLQGLDSHHPVGIGIPDIDLRLSDDHAILNDFVPKYIENL